WSSWPPASPANARPTSPRERPSWSSLPSSPSGLLHHHDPVARPGDRTGQDQQRTLAVGAQHDQVLHGDAVHALMRSHAQSLQHAAGRRARSDRALTTQVVRAVGLRSAREVMKMDRTLEPLALRDAGDVDLVADGEAVDADALPGREAGDVVDAHFAQVIERRQLPEVTALSFRHLLLRDRAEADLHRGVAVTLFGGHAGDEVRLCGDDRRADHRPVGPEVLEHADLAA